MAKIKLLPKSLQSKYSCIFILLMLILFYIGMSSANLYSSTTAGETILHDLTLRPGVSIPMILAFSSGIFAFIIGLIGITKKKDYSLLSILSTIIGFFVLVWVFLEIFLAY